MISLRHFLPVSLAVVLLGVAATTARPQESPGQFSPSARIRLKHIKPSRLISLMRNQGERNRNMLPMGLTTLSPDDLRHVLAVEGDKESVERMMEVCRLLDAPAQSVKFEVRVLRTKASQSNSDTSPTVVTTATGDTRNDEVATVPLIVDGKYVDVTVLPHVNGDGTVTVQSSVTMVTEEVKPGEEPAIRRQSESNIKVTRVIKPKSRARFFGLVGGQFVQAKDLPVEPGHLLFEVSPEVIPAPR